jgi:putative spermidine/putrescine transport system ATP-binding protein
MDEPLSSLDNQLREQLQYEIKSLQRATGITFVYVTHDQTEAMVMSDRVAVFYQGRIQQIDTPDRLYEHPDNAFVAKFIGENNIIKPNVYIRPERVQIDPEYGTVDTMVNGTVQDITFLGRHIRLRLQVCEIDDFIVTLPNHGLRLDLQIGSTVTLGWAAADCRTINA